MLMTSTRGLGACLIVVGLWGILAGCDTSGATVTTGGGNGPLVDPGAPGPDLLDDDPNAGPAELVSINDGGGDLADRLGGATYTGQAQGPSASGSLSLIFDQQGVLLSLGGTVLGDFLGLGDQSEIIFDYQTDSVTGTVAGQPLQNFLTATEQSIQIRNVLVVLALDSLLITTTYNAVVDAHPQGDREIQLQGTVRFATNQDIRGALLLPGITDPRVPLFTLDRQ